MTQLEVRDAVPPPGRFVGRPRERDRRRPEVQWLASLASYRPGRRRRRKETWNSWKGRSDDPSELFSVFPGRSGRAHRHFRINRDPIRRVANRQGAH